MKNTTKKIIAILIVLVSIFGVYFAIDYNNKTDYVTSTINPTPKVSYQYRICRFYEFDTNDTITFEDEDGQLWAVYNDFTVNKNANYLMMFNENEEIISIMEIIK